MDKILTIVIPTYNIEKYIENCLQSFLIKEVMDDIEVLVVNDGSTDSSADKAKFFEDAHPGTYRIINKINGGHGSTINTGIQSAHGKYFKVVDGDDWVEKDAFIKLVEFLKGCNSDIVASNYYWVDDISKKKSIEKARPFSKVVFKREYNFPDVSDKTFIKMHAMTIKTSILRHNEMPIDEHCFYVDMEYVLFPIPNVKTVTFLDEFVYMYRVGLPTQSMNIKSMQRNKSHYKKVFCRLLEFYAKQRESGCASSCKSYLENNIAIMIAGYFKILLSFPPEKAIKSEMKQFDLQLKHEYPAIYYASKSRAVKLLRMSGYALYRWAHYCFILKERF